MAFQTVYEKKAAEKLKKNPNDDGFTLEINMFPEYYKQELLKDAKKPPREFDEKEYLEYKVKPHELIKEEYIPIRNRKNEYFKGYERYKENKKEGYDRNKLFFVLEQYFAKSQQEQSQGK